MAEQTWDIHAEHKSGEARPARALRVGQLLAQSAPGSTFCYSTIFLFGTVVGHEGHDHDKPAPLNLPMAPRVVAVTPDYELVGVLSGEQRLTIFLHHFGTGEPVKDAKIAVSTDEQEVEALAKEDGVFELTAPWLRTAEAIDLIFKLTLPRDQDILTGRLKGRARLGRRGLTPPARLPRTKLFLLVLEH